MQFILSEFGNVNVAKCDLLSSNTFFLTKFILVLSFRIHLWSCYPNFITFRLNITILLYNLYEVTDFLWDTVYYCFRDIARYWSKIADFSYRYPTCI